MPASVCLPGRNKRARFARLGGVLALALLLNACVTQKSVSLPDISAWESRQAVLGALDQWRFNGRIAVKTSDDGFNGKLRWEQSKDAFEATVSGPLGFGTVRIEGDENGVQITDKDGVTTVLRDVEAELYYRYGWTIPVQSLRYWVLGIPDPRVPAETQFDDEERASRIEQRGWGVEVGRYREAGGQQMPARLIATREETTVRMVIDNWVFSSVVDTS